MPSKDYEDFSFTIYDASPPNGDWTIGWGHKLYEGTTEYNYYYANGITIAEAEKLYIEDRNKMASTTLDVMIEKYGIILNQHQYDAMLSFSYQFGEYSWSDKDSEARETMRDFIKAGDYSENATKTAFSMYMGSRAANGTIARLNDTIQMFLYGDYEREYDYSRP